MNTTVNNNRKKKCNPGWQQVKEYFDTFSRRGASGELWELLKLGLIADNDTTSERERSNMIFFYECTLELFASIHTLLQKRKLKP